MNGLVLTHDKLPATIEELSKFVLVGREKIISLKAEIRAIDKLNLAREVRDQKKEEASMLSELLMDAEVKLGDLMKEIPTAQGKRTDVKLRDSAVPKSEKSKEEIIENLGFSKKQAQRFEILANNKDIVEQVKAEARENDDIPTRTKVLNMVASQKKQEEDYYRKLDLGHEVFKKLAKIYDVIDNFDINIENISALTEYFDENMPLTEQIEFINDAMKKLERIKIELMRVRNNEKRKKINL